MLRFGWRRAEDELSVYINKYAKFETRASSHDGSPRNQEFRDENFVLPSRENAVAVLKMQDALG